MTAGDHSGEKHGENRPLVAYQCQNGHLTVPDHPVCPTCGEPQTGTVELTDRPGEVVTWTTVTTSPPGVREPNTLALVEFTVEGDAVRIIGGTTDDVSSGDRVRPVHVDQLRDPAVAIRATASQQWDGYRFEPVEDD